MPLSTQQFFDKLKAWGLPHAAGLAGVYSFCVATGVAFSEFVGGALASSLASDRIQGIFQSLDDGIDPEALQKDLAELSQGENERALEELITTVTSSEQFQKWLSEHTQNELRESLKQEVDALHEKWSKRLTDIVGAPPFDIHGTIGGLLNDVSRVASYGLINVVDRPESQAIVSALQGPVTNQVFLRGRALSGKTFLAFKVAQRWIVSGGQVAWMRSGADITNYIAKIQTTGIPAKELPLIVWDSPFDETIERKVFEQLQRYDGPVLTTVRVGDRYIAPSTLDDILEGNGFQDGGWKDDRLTPTAKKVSVFLGPITGIGRLISANVKAGNYSMTITDIAKSAIASRISVGHDERATTLLGLAKAYLMAFAKQGVTDVDEQAVHDLEGPNRDKLTSEQLVAKIFSETVDEQDKQFLTVLKLYRDWTFVEAMHQDVLTAALSAYRKVENLQTPDRREELTRRGVLIHRPPWYSAWHDLQLDVLPPISSASVSAVLDKTVGQLIADMKALTVTEEKDQLAAVLNDFALELWQIRHWDDSLKLQQAAVDIRHDIAQTAGDNANLRGSLANSYNNIGVLLDVMGRHEKAQSYYNQALIIRRELAKNQPAKYKPMVAGTCNNLGIINYRLGQFAKAIELYQEALDIYEELGKDQPEIYQPEVAQAYNNMGISLDALDKQEDAYKVFKKALAIRGILAGQKPGVYLPDLATSYHNLGNVLSQMGKYTEAEGMYQKALELGKQLAKAMPEAFLPGLAGICNSYGFFLVNSQRSTEAKDYYIESLKILRPYAKKQPDAYLPEVARTSLNLGELLESIGDFTGASGYFQEALSIYFTLFSGSPDFFSGDLAATIEIISRIVNNPAFDDRENWLRQTLGQMLEAFNVNLLSICKRLGDLSKDAGFPAMALEPYLFAKLALEKLNHPDAATAQTDVESLRGELGQEFEPLCRQLEEKFAPMLEDISDDSLSPV